MQNLTSRTKLRVCEGCRAREAGPGLTAAAPPSPSAAIWGGAGREGQAQPEQDAERVQACSGTKMTHFKAGTSCMAQEMWGK